MSAYALTPEKSPNDDRQYRYQVLDNGLQVLLISDPGADKGAAALDVHVGSGDEPDDRAGIAHFLEHMLFLGTEKYPEAGEYQQFISSHGGSHNASTSFQHTNYYFDISADSLEPALDRFSQQFVAPLFNPELVERERNAVHSEYTSKLKDDGRRFFSAFKAALHPEHRYNRFSVGNLETLSDDEGTLRQDVVDFYREHYDAGIMTLAVYGPQSLDTLEKWVRERFAALPSGDARPYRHTTPLLEQDQLPAKLQVQALKDTRRLQLSFPIPSLQDDYRAKPASYVANLIGHEGPGSLLDVLKKAGLANALSAGASLDTGENALFQISVSLTPEGLERWRDVVALTFDYIDMIREDGIRREYYEEQKQLAEIDFRFAEKTSPIHLVTRLAGLLHIVEPEDVLSAPYLMEDYAPEHYRAILERLRPDNVLVSILSPNTVESPERTQWYNTAYTISPLEGDTLQAGGSDRADGDIEALASRLSLPAPNPFVPEDLELVSGPDHPEPLRLTTEPFTVWYGRDTSFGTPRANVYLSLRSPAATESVRGAMLARLWVESVKDQVNAHAYAARLAGLDYALYSHLRGVTLRVSGYNDKLHELLGLVMSAITRTELDRSRFAIHRQQLIESLENNRKDKPYNQALGLLTENLIEEIWPLEKRLEVARTLTFEDLQAYVPDFLAALDPVMLAHGNLTPAAALNLSTMVNARLPEETRFTTVPRSDVRQLGEGSRHLKLPVDHPDTGYVRYIQGPDTSYDARAGYRLLSQLVSAPFYQSLRTEQQLGYVVFANAYEMLEMPGLVFVIQSPVADAQTLDAQVRDFLNRYEARLEAMPQAVFEQQKASVISRLTEEDKTLQAISDRWWREIDRENFDFDNRQQMVEGVKEIDKETALRLYRQGVEQLNRSLLVTTYGEEDSEGPAEQLSVRETEDNLP